MLLSRQQFNHLLRCLNYHLSGWLNYQPATKVLHCLNVHFVYILREILAWHLHPISSISSHQIHNSENSVIKTKAHNNPQKSFKKEKKTNQNKTGTSRSTNYSFAQFLLGEYYLHLRGNVRILTSLGAWKEKIIGTNE